MADLGIRIHNRWDLGQKIAEGGFGAVYTGTDIHTGEEVAIKMMAMDEHLRGRRGNLEAEARALAGVAGTTRGGKRGIPRVLWHGQECEYYVLVTEILGPSLDDLQQYCGGKLSMKTVLMIADQAIARLQTIHNSGWLHRDIKPHNFLLGTGKSGNTMYAIDMGLAMKWTRARESHRRTPNAKREFMGTPDFASLNSHKGKELSYRDDLESLGYMLMLLHTAELPWSPLDESTSWDTERIEKKKEEISIEELCGNFPRAFRLYFKYIQTLGFYDKPDYGRCRRYFRQALKEMGARNDNVFDWTERMWNELYPPTQSEPEEGDETEDG